MSGSRDKVRIAVIGDSGKFLFELRRVDTQKSPFEKGACVGYSQVRTEWKLLIFMVLEEIALFQVLYLAPLDIPESLKAPLTRSLKPPLLKPSSRSPITIPFLTLP